MLLSRVLRNLNSWGPPSLALRNLRKSTKLRDSVQIEYIEMLNQKWLGIKTWSIERMQGKHLELDPVKRKLRWVCCSQYWNRKFWTRSGYRRRLLPRKRLSKVQRKSSRHPELQQVKVPMLWREWMRKLCRRLDSGLTENEQTWQAVQPVRLRRKHRRELERKRAKMRAVASIFQKWEPSPSPPSTGDHNRLGQAIPRCCLQCHHRVHLRKHGLKGQVYHLLPAQFKPDEMVGSLNQPNQLNN